MRLVVISRAIYLEIIVRLYGIYSENKINFIFIWYMAAIFVYTLQLSTKTTLLLGGKGVSTLVFI